MTLCSIPCKKCGNVLWEVWDSKAECTNCLTIRPFHSRSNRVQTTPSQQKTIERIRKYFEGHWSTESAKLYKFSIFEQEETGYRYVSVYTTDNIYTQVGGHFCIGRRGGITVLSAYDLCENKQDRVRYYAKILGGKVSKY